MTDQSPQARIRQLEIENGRLLDQVDVLKGALADEDVILPAEWRLSPTEDQVFRVMLRRDVARLPAFMAAIYSDRPDPPEDKIVQVFIFRMRRKLRPFGISIHRVRNVGYALDEATREKFREKRAA